MVRRLIEGLFQQIAGLIRTSAVRNYGTKLMTVSCSGGYEESGALAGVMGLQGVEDVTLVRHAYVHHGSQKHGIGAQLLDHLRALASGPVLIGT